MPTALRPRRPAIPFSINGAPSPSAATPFSVTLRPRSPWRDAGTAVPFATIRIADGAVIGSTRFFDIERFAWPAGHPRHGRVLPDVCEIGYTWLAHAALRTAANTEAKLPDADARL